MSHSGSSPHGVGKPDAEQHHAIALASGGQYLEQSIPCDVNVRRQHDARRVIISDHIAAMAGLLHVGAVVNDGADADTPLFLAGLERNACANRMRLLAELARPKLTLRREQGRG